MASSAISVCSATPQANAPPSFGDTADWAALQPAEQAQVILAAYEEWLLPELTRIERLLTRVAVVCGLEYGRIEELAILFLEVTHEVRRHVRALELSAAYPSWKVAAKATSDDDADMFDLVVRLQSVTKRCQTDQATSPCYARLIEVLRRCEQELVELVELEARLSQP